MSENNKISIKTMREIRSFAFHLLYVAESFGYSVSMDEIVQAFRDGYDVEIEDDSRAILIAARIIEERNELDAIISPLLKNWSIDRLGVCTLLILRLAIWELKEGKIPPSIVINEAIELAKSFSEKDAYKFINGLLDKVCETLNITVERIEPKVGVDNESEDKSGIR